MAELEQRYFVIKRKDLDGALEAKMLGVDGLAALQHILDQINTYRTCRGASPLQVLCIEKDWPEYEDFKSKILHRAAKEEIVDRISPILRDNLAFPDDVIRQVEKIIDSALPKEPSDGRTN